MSDKLAVVYHWWSNQSPDRTFRCPILCSIATLRKHNPHLPIYVLDVTPDSQHDWLHWENKLRFKVFKYLPYLRKHFRGEVDFYSLTEPSRHLDLYHFSKLIPENVIFYADSDVFFVKPLELPPVGDKLVSPVFTAYFYFHKDSSYVREWMNLYTELCNRCLINDEFLARCYSFCPYNIKNRRLWSEVITYYVERSPDEPDMRALTRPINLTHFANIDQAYRFGKIHEAKSLHMFYNCAGRYDEMDAVALFKEFREPCEQLLGKKFVERLKPGMKRRLSVYDQGFASKLRGMMQNRGNKPLEHFIEQAYRYAKA